MFFGLYYFLMFIPGWKIEPKDIADFMDDQNNSTVIRMVKEAQDLLDDSQVCHASKW